jgi:signal transduction histidine kinase
MPREMGPVATGATPREQRLAAAGRVAAGLLHEFRNVLAPIANLAFVLEHQADDPAKVRDLARRLGELAQVRGRVADRLRDYIRQDAARFPEEAVVDLSAVARETVAMCRAAAVPGVVVECDAAQPLPVRGEGAELRIAACELLANAIDAVSQGGTVRVVARAADGYAILVGRDDGAGVAEGMAELAFDPFISTKAGADAGLGLSAAWGIVHRHDGELTLGTRAGSETVATLTLPLASRDS